MPSHELISWVGADLTVPTPGSSGHHYARTLRAWLARLDANAEPALEVLSAGGRSEQEARRLLATWRLFLISTEVIWRYRSGNRWLVSHYLLEPRAFGGNGKKPDVRAT